jgi:glycosyltransferase involved in cell wall biosynthesis
MLTENAIHPLSMGVLSNSRIVWVFLPVLLFVYTAKYIMRYNLDVVMNANNHKWMLPVALACRLWGKKSVARVTGDLFPRKSASLKRKTWLYYQKMIEKLSLLSVDHILCLGKSLEQLVVQRVGLQSKISVLSQGVDSAKFSMSRNGNDFTTELKRLVFIGRIESNKNLHFALEAFKRLRENDYRLLFDIYGEGSQRIALEQVYGNVAGIKFHGELKHDEVPGVLSKGGILLLPSTFEGNPNSVLEGMASGVFVIASRAGENRFLLGEGERGLLLESTTSEAIYEMIIFALEHPKYVSEAIIRARKYVEDNHSYENLHEKYLALLANETG